jgi:hypothetical protein
MQEQFCGRPPGMAGVPQMQEQFCGRPPGMAGVPQMQEQFAAPGRNFADSVAAGAPLTP